jgi:hypothetical protein
VAGRTALVAQVLDGLHGLPERCVPFVRICLLLPPFLSSAPPPCFRCLVFVDRRKAIGVLLHHRGVVYCTCAWVLRYACVCSGAGSVHPLAGIEGSDVGVQGEILTAFESVLQSAAELVTASLSDASQTPSAAAGTRP